MEAGGGGTSLVVQWLSLCLLIERVQVRSLVWELGSCMPHGQEKQNIKQQQYYNGFSKDLRKKEKEAQKCLVIVTF